MARDTRGSRRTLRSFWRPRAELKITCWPSKSHHTGVTCGRPSGISVPRLAKAGFWKRSRYFSGITLDIASSLLDRFICVPDYRCRKGNDGAVNWYADDFGEFDSRRRSFPVRRLALLPGRNGVCGGCRSRRGEFAQGCGSEIQARTILRAT